GITERRADGGDAAARADSTKIGWLFRISAPDFVPNFLMDSRLPFVVLHSPRSYPGIPAMLPTLVCDMTRLRVAFAPSAACSRRVNGMVGSIHQGCGKTT